MDFKGSGPLRRKLEIVEQSPHIFCGLELSRTSQMDLSGLRGHVESIRSCWMNIVQICIKNHLKSYERF